MSNTTVYYGFLDEYSQKISMLQQRMKIVSLVIYILAFLVGSLGNGLVIFITGFHMKKTVNTIWFLNLAIVDFIFILSLLFVRVAVDFQWYINEFSCKMKDTVISINMYASVYILMVISIDRCIFVRHPIWAQNHRKPRQASFVALGVWIVALVLSFPTFYFAESKEISEINITFCTEGYGNTADTLMARKRDVIVSHYIFAFVIPFTVIVLCYGMIVLKLRSSQLFQSSKSYKIMTALIATFFVCWFPYHVFSFIALKHSSDRDMQWVLVPGQPIAMYMAFINSCINPILYVFMARGFKDSLKWSIFSALENAFTEEVRQTSMTNKTKTSAEVELQE